MELKPGTRLYSGVSGAELIVIRVTDPTATVTIGGVAALTNQPEASALVSVSDGHADQLSVGKRYVDAAATIELLCTKAGGGTLAVGDEVLLPKDAKPLPASD